MTDLYVRFINWLHKDRGAFSFEGGNILWLVVAILIIVCLVVWLIINVDFDTKDEVAWIADYALERAA